MKINKIRIKDGYKRFHDLTIDLGTDPKRIVALVGPNGCGKSSVFDAMLFVANSHLGLGNTGIKNHHYHSMTSSTGINHKAVEIDFCGSNIEQLIRKDSYDRNNKTLFSFRSPYR